MEGDDTFTSLYRKTKITENVNTRLKAMKNITATHGISYDISDEFF